MPRVKKSVSLPFREEDFAALENGSPAEIDAAHRLLVLKMYGPSVCFDEMFAPEDSSQEDSYDPYNDDSYDPFQDEPEVPPLDLVTDSIGDNEVAQVEDLVSDQPAVPEAPDDPTRLARAVAAKYKHREGSTLVYFQGGFYVYDDQHFRHDPEFKSTLVPMVKAILDSQHLEAVEEEALGLEDRALMGARGRTPTRGRTVPKVTKGLISDVIQSLIPMVRAPAQAQAPFWQKTKRGDPAPLNVLVAQNGLVNIGTNPPQLIPHTPRFFSTCALPYNYDPATPSPETWLRFLRDQWADDPQSIDSIHEVFGYLLTPDTHFQKMFWLIGPPGSGRGTTKGVMVKLVGEHNVVQTSATTMNGEFGMEPLIGKNIAVFADFRLGRDSAIVTERFLRVSGDDAVEVNRKNKSILPNVRITARFVLLSNDLPEFRDASNAMSRRYQILRMAKIIPESKRDHDLLAKLVAELPGILNLAIEGRKRLYDRGRFVQPDSGIGLLETAKGLASPVKRCVDECFKIREEAWIAKSEAYRLWTEWAQKNGEHPGPSATFGKNLFAAVPGLDAARRRTEGKEVTVYVGIEALNPPTKEK